MIPALLASLYLSVAGGHPSVARVGTYVADFWAVEGEVGWKPHHLEMGADVLWHWWGYERFDPFLTLGVKGYTNWKYGALPSVGTGAFYHLTDNWSIRADVSMYPIAGNVGVQYEF